MSRNVKKTASFALVHFMVAFVLSWLLTGSLFIAGALALLEPLVNTVAYFFHELFWNRGGKESASPG